MDQVNVIFQVVGAQPRSFTVDQGTTLDEFMEERDVGLSDHVVMVNSQQRPPEYVLQEGEVVFANRRRSHG